MFNQFRHWAKRSWKRAPKRRFQTETPGTVSYNMVKKALLRTTYTPRLFTVGALIGCGAALFTYWNERNYTPEAALGIALTKLSSDDPEIKQEGFRDLNEALYIQKRFFSGPVGIPVPPKALASKHVMQVLLDNVSSVNQQNSMSALCWILKLVSKTRVDEDASTYVDQAQRALLETDPKLEKLTNLLQQQDYTATREWIVASHILLDLDNKYFDTLPLQPILDGIASLASSQNALAIATATMIASKPIVAQNLPSNVIAVINKNTGSPFFAKVTVDAASTTLEACASEFKARGSVPYPKSALWSLLTVPIFGHFWGRTMWGISSNSNPEYRKLKNDYGTDQTNPHRQRFIKSRKIGLALFLLLSFDLLASIMPQYLAGREVPIFGNKLTEKEWKEQQLTVWYPTIQTGVFTAITISLINYYRFVMIPLVIAGVINHNDLLIKTGIISESVADAPRNHLNALIRKVKGTKN